MFMISAVITLLGVISPTRLPVDLMPEFEQPQLTVRTSYAGVGPLEMEELITRPMEQAVSAVPGVTASNRARRKATARCASTSTTAPTCTEAPTTSAPASTACATACPEDADPPTIFKFDSNTQPIMQIGVEGDYDPLTLREMAQNEIAPRFERVDGVAAVTVNGGLRRQIHVELSKEKSPRSTSRSTRWCNALRYGEPEHAARRDLPGRLHLPAPQPGPVPEPRGHPERGRHDPRSVPVYIATSPR